MTSFGQPDLQGDWNNATLTPFVRPKALWRSRLTMTPEEAAKIEKGRSHRPKGWTEAHGSQG